MKVYKLIADARVKFQNSSIKKSGLNKFAGYSYYELSDILPVINRLGSEMGFTCLVSFTSERAELKIIAHEDGSEVIFLSPMATASLKGCHDVQNLGAVQTYIKRYLYQNAFEIVEGDVLDGTMNPSEPQKPLPKAPYNKQQIPVANSPKEAEREMAKIACTELGNELGLPMEQRKTLLTQMGGDFLKVKQRLQQMKKQRDAEVDAEAVQIPESIF